MSLQPMFKLETEVLRTSLFLGKPLTQTILWSEGQNIEFGPGGPRKRRGISTDASIAGVTGSLRGGGQLLTSTGVRNLFTGDTAELYKADGVGPFSSVGSGYSGNANQTATDPATVWSFQRYGDWMIASNGVDNPQIYKGTSFAALGGITSVFDNAEVVRARGPHIMVFKTNNHGAEFLWTDEDNPEVWLPSSSNAAGGLTIREASSDIVAAEPLLDKIAVYTEDGVYLVSYIGAPFYFNYVPALSDRGAVSKQSVIPVGRQHYVCGPRGFYVTDGLQSQWIDDPWVRQYFQDNLNWDQRTTVNGFHDEDRQQVIWWFPTGTNTSGDTGLVYSYQYNTWGIYTPPEDVHTSLERDVLEFPYVFWDTNSGGSFGEDADDASPTVAYIRTKPMDLGDFGGMKHLHGIRVQQNGNGCRVRIGTYEDDLDSPINWSGYQAIGSGLDYLEFREAGRYFVIEFQSEDAGAAWEITGVEVYGRPGGRR